MRTVGIPHWIRRWRGLWLACWALVALPLQAARPVLSVGWDDYPPYQIQVGGERPGIDMEIAELALRQAGYTVRFVKLPWARQLLQLRTGELDMAMAASVSQDRGGYVVWSEPYRRERASLIALAGRMQGPQPSSLRQLLSRGVRVGVIRDSSYPGEFERLSADPAFLALLEPTVINQQNLLKLRAGRIDYLIDDPVAIGYLASSLSGPPVSVLFDVMDADARFMLSKRSLARDPVLLQRLNAALARLLRSPEWADIQRRYGLSAPLGR
jgi:polar amino acid transport system substrate-binding protein